jgi:hypothetical protein
VPLTFELASFRVDAGSEASLLEERPAMVAALRRAFPGALGAWLTKQDDGSWLDVILWRSREEAREAARRIDEVPEARRWFRHIAESQGVRHVEVAHEELFGLLEKHRDALAPRDPADRLAEQPRDRHDLDPGR